MVRAGADDIAAERTPFCAAPEVKAVEITGQVVLGIRRKQINLIAMRAEGENYFGPPELNSVS